MSERADLWKDNAYRWRDLYVQLRERTGEGDTAEVVRVESQTRRLSERDGESAA
jgi:hypothetical protein